MTIDIVTFLIAVGALLLVHIPQPPLSAEAEDNKKTSLLQESFFGFRYIYERPSLLGLQLVFFCINFISMFGFALLIPMILLRTNNDEIALASVQSVSAIGGVVGGLLLSAWGGPKKKVHGVLLGMLATSILGQALFGLGQTILIWSIAGFMAQMLLPILNGSNQAIWQAKVAPEVQGRVFSVRRLIAQITAPVATAVAGPLADNIFEPAMQSESFLSNLFGPIVGKEPGGGHRRHSGMFGVLISLGGYLFPMIRNAESNLPDHVMVHQVAD